MNINTTLLLCVLIVLLIFNLILSSFLEEYRLTHPPFGEVSEILILSKDSRMYALYSEQCKEEYGDNNVHLYLNCTEGKMKDYLKEQDEQIIR